MNTRDLFFWNLDYPGHGATAHNFVDVRVFRSVDSRLS